MHFEQLTKPRGLKPSRYFQSFTVRPKPHRDTNQSPQRVFQQPGLQALKSRITFCSDSLVYRSRLKRRAKPSTPNPNKIRVDGSGTGRSRTSTTDVLLP